jgi:hypothetical protein
MQIRTAFETKSYLVDVARAGNSALTDETSRIAEFA